MLRSLRSEDDWYLGKPSIEKPLEIMDRDSPDPAMKVSIIFIIIICGEDCLKPSLNALSKTGH